MSGPRTDSRSVSLKIDGRELRAPEGAFALEVARAAGIEIPTLCDDPALEPVGACRLCMIEVTHPDWNGWSGLMTACLYPVSEGLEVSSCSPRVLASRKQTLTLLAARCPRSEKITELARQHGVCTEGLLVDPAADNCILCGLCTRVCETWVTSAITTLHRGATKAIGSFANRPPADCVGCGACALICPTDNIPAERGATEYSIWGRGFETAVCRVERTRCVGCGSCEEACPFAVARVALSSDGRRVARIAAEHCRGCGACVGACPNAAIDQVGHEGAALAARLSRTSVSVLACGRSDLARRELPENVQLIELPCTGRATSSLALRALTHGAGGVLVLGRHQESCRLRGAEDPARASIERARAALGMLGYQPERLRFDLPAAGSEGPLEAVRAFSEAVNGLGRVPLAASVQPGPFLGEGLDEDLALLGSLSQQDGLVPDAGAWLARHDLPAPAGDGALLYAGRLPYYSVLAEQLLAPLSIPDVLRMALALLETFGASAVGVRVAGCGPLRAHHAALFEGAAAVHALTSADAEELRAVGVQAQSIEELLLARAVDGERNESGVAVACGTSPAAARRIEALGYRALVLADAPLPASFCASPVQREQAEASLAAAEARGARALYVPDADALVRWSLLTRSGTWRSSTLRPLMMHQLAWFASSGTELCVSEIESPSRLAARIQEVSS